MFKTILLVDDEETAALLGKKMLEDIGCRVLGPAGSGDAALKEVARERPDLVLMDVRLDSNVDGATVAEEIYVCHKVPVVFLTAANDDETMRRASLSGAYGYLVKPISRDVLRAAILMALAKHDELARLTQSFSDHLAVMVGVQIPVVVTGVDQTVLFANAPALSVLGVRSAAARGNRISDFIDLSFLPTALVEKNVWDPRTTGEIEGESTLYSRGKSVRANIRMKPVLEPSESGYAFVWTLEPRSDAK